MQLRLHEAPRPSPTYQEEAWLLERGHTVVAGLDEVGRGPLAGPVVAGAVVLPQRPEGEWLREVRDSKQMTRLQRERVFASLQSEAVSFDTGACSPLEVDDIGIVAATRLAMERALDGLGMRPDFLLLDAFPLPGVRIPQKPIIHGDALCLSIAAASVVAKITRDRFMEEQDERHPGYGFARHKGYATREHLRNLRRLGPSPIHRYSFAPLRLTGLTR